MCRSVVRRRIILSATAISFMLVSGALATTLYVSPGGSAAAPYTNWAIAANSIQTAIDASVSGDQIVVDSGTYYESIEYFGKNIEVVSRYHLTTNTEYIANTIIDGSNTFRCVTITNGESSAAMLRGFTLQNGRADAGGYYQASGGGIQTRGGADPRLEDLVVKNNWAGSDGGGVYCEWSDASFRNVRIEGNVAMSSGAGLRTSYGTLSFENVEVVGNTSAAGALFFYHNDATLKNVLIVDNVATGEGAKIGAGTRKV